MSRSTTAVEILMQFAALVHDELGGILAVLERPNQYYTYVAVNPPPTTGLHLGALEMTGFIDALKRTAA
jgi:hypothetical protein